MNTQAETTNAVKAAAAFTAQSLYFDEIYSSGEIIRYKRERVRNHLRKYLRPGSRILELNAGTGEDALFLARLGYYVHATDVSGGMQEILKQKVRNAAVEDRVTAETCSFTTLGALQVKGPYDAMFSNFAGLNCTGDLEAVLQSFDALLKPGGILVLVILPSFCLFETLLLLKGRFRTAFRRFFSAGGRKAKIDGNSFTCWYYNPGFVKKIMKEKYEELALEGLCCFVPPSYIESFPEKYPRLYSWLCKTEDRLKNKWPWRSVGDYYIISFRKK